MIINKIGQLNEKLYYEKLDNGLEVYIVPNNKVNNSYVSFNTKFGGDHQKFISSESGKMIEVPSGIAHFLEHKIFEQKDGIDALRLFTKNGVNCNAGTWKYQTSYLFQGKVNYEKNLKFLLDFVQNIYLTNEQIEKEKGIILEEKRMEQDEPDSIIFNTVFKNLFVNAGAKESVLGTVEDIKKITKENLECCHNNFYHPSNMNVCVTGNVDPIETIKIIKENQEAKDYVENPIIKLPNYNEPAEVAKKYEEIEMDIELPKLMIGIKIPILSKGITKYKQHLYLSALFLKSFDGFSDFSINSKKDNLVADDFFIYVTTTDNFFVVFIENESSNPKKLKASIEKEIGNLKLTEAKLKQFQKKVKGNAIRMFDNIEGLNIKMFTNVFEYDDVKLDTGSLIDEMSHDKAARYLNKINFINTSTAVVKPIEK